MVTLPSASVSTVLPRSLPPVIPNVAGPTPILVVPVLPSLEDSVCAPSRLLYFVISFLSCSIDVAMRISSNCCWYSGVPGVSANDTDCDAAFLASCVYPMLATP